jgi:hypothetical protein
MADVMKLLHTTDAKVWAKEFCETFGGNTVNGGVVNLELMFGWFANAIETGSAAGRKEGTDG